MFHKNIVALYYFFITILMVLSPMNYNFWDFIPALVFIWIIYFFFILGINSKLRMYASATIQGSSYIKTSNAKKKNELERIYVFLALSFVLFTPLYIKFYTGNTVINSIVAFVSSSATGADSNYSQYQRYFVENNISNLTINKMFYIICYAILKFLFWLSTLKIIVYSDKYTYRNVISVLLMTISTLLIGISRGTSVEFFEVGTLFVFSFFSRLTIRSNRDRLSTKSIIKLSVIPILGFAFFSYSKSLRYKDRAVTVFSQQSKGETFFLNYNSRIVDYFPNISYFVYELSGYFLFGPYFISEMLKEFYIGNGIKGLLYSFLPMGSLIVNNMPIKEFMCKYFIECGPRWIPDSVKVINLVGFPVFFLIVFLIGMLSRYSCIQARNGSVLYLLLLHIIVLQLFSLPIGNFVVSSSSTILTTLICIILINTNNKFSRFISNA